ncbi:hypothetical protein AB0M46_30405 [Dactylosporangium sp. NPDC051485]|uniref:hypothetical protein n=1 Tax=Dactylosporangium sp. NPDC051485 TaxID=3154846 RepID=UPI003424FC15
MTVQPTMLRPATRRPAWQTVLGLVLALPALVLLITSYVEPAVWTIRTSFRRFTGIRTLSGGDPPSAGWDNYERAYDQGLAGSFWHVLSLVAIPLLAVLVLAPALAWAAHSSGRVVRWAARGALVIPLAAFSPYGIALAAALAERGQRWAYWSGTFGVFVAVAALVYLAAFRTNRSPWPAVIVCAGLSVLGVTAAVLQEFTYGWAFRFADQHGPDTPATMMYERAFITLNFGTAAAIAATVLVPLLLLGALATAVFALTGLRLQWRPDIAGAPSPRRGAARPVAVVLLVLVLAAALAGLWPWLSHLGQQGRPDAPSTWVNTWIPPLVSTLVGVSAAALAAFGISGLRPLGRHSEWLLMPFGLFLFVGGMPLVLRAYAAGATAARLDSFAALVPPSRLAIPALFAFALLFRGQAMRREALLQEGRPASWWPVLVPGLPMAGLLCLGTWLVQAQDVLWPLVTSTSNYPTAQLEMVRVLQVGDTEHLPYGALLPIPMLVFFLLAGVAAQLFLADKAALQVGPPERDHPPRT